MIDITDESKLKFTSDEYSEYLETIRESRTWEAPKFVTQCWFLTLQSHHLGIIPAIQRYQKLLRASKELQRMVDELNATKSQWENTPLARRNKQVRDRCVHQINKINRWWLYFTWFSRTFFDESFCYRLFFVVKCGPFWLWLALIGFCDVV